MNRAPKSRFSNHPQGDGEVLENMATTLVGGAPFSAVALREATEVAPHIVAVDGGANRLRRLGVLPDLVIGDMDSISDQTKRWVGSDRLRKIDDPNTTDFEKALASVQTQVFLAVGFTGARMDHSLAVMNAIALNFARKALLISSRDIIFVSPRRLQLDLPIGTRISFFPMGEVRGKSRGLRWELDPLYLSPTGTISASNETSQASVSISFDSDKVIVILPRKHLQPVLAGLRWLTETGEDIPQ
jgi:thiamine pyrophosphokinase